MPHVLGDFALLHAYIVLILNSVIQQGRRISFKNTLIIMTSNVGSTAIAKGRRTTIGFLIADDSESSSYAGMKALVMEELKAYFRPELLNRIDEVVVFHPLEKTQVCALSHTFYIRFFSFSKQWSLFNMINPSGNILCIRGKGNQVRP